MKIFIDNTIIWKSFQTTINWNIQYRCIRFLIFNGTFIFPKILDLPIKLNLNNKKINMEAINFALMMIYIIQLKKKFLITKKQRLSEAFSILKVCFWVLGYQYPSLLVNTSTAIFYILPRICLSRSCTHLEYNMTKSQRIYLNTFLLRMSNFPLLKSNSHRSMIIYGIFILFLQQLIIAV